MSLRINNNAYNIIALMAIVLFLLSVSVWHLSKNNFQSPARCHLAHQTAVKINQIESHLTTSKSNPKSVFPNTCQLANHCLTCGSLITDYVISFDYATESEQYRPIKFIPVYKAFIPELKPPKIA